MLATASRARALLQGRDFVLPDDVKYLAGPTLRHRIVLAPSAEVEGLTPDIIIQQVIERVPTPR
jgi:MoxR-like ATPase